MYKWEYIQEKCEVCDAKFDNKKGLKRHTQIAHKRISSELNKNNQRDKCNVKVTDTEELKLHMERVHEQEINSTSNQNIHPEKRNQIIHPAGRMVHFNVEEIHFNEEHEFAQCENCRKCFQTAKIF